MSDLERRRRPKKEVAPRHIPELVIPIPLAEAPQFVHDALRGTSLVDPIASYYTKGMLFTQRLRYSEVDEAHTRIEVDVTGVVRGVDTLFFAERRGLIDRFFVAVQDELDRRERWRPHPRATGEAIEGAGSGAPEAIEP